MRILVFSAVIGWLVAPLAAQEPIAVFVLTAQDSSGLKDDATAERLKAVTDVRKRLEKNRAVRLVDSADAAKVSIEVLSAGPEKGERQTVATTTVVGGVAITQPGQAMTEFIARATITSGTFKTAIEASIGPFGRSYGENLARKFEDWLKKNQAALQGR